MEGSRLVCVQSGKRPSHLPIAPPSYFLQGPKVRNRLNATHPAGNRKIVRAISLANLAPRQGYARPRASAVDTVIAVKGVVAQVFGGSVSRRIASPRMLLN